jgi:hypothetical protein
MDQANRCIEHGSKVDSLLEQMDNIHDSVKNIAAYVPKIEVALERLANVQDVMKGYSEVHKELFKIHRSTVEDLNMLKMRVTTNEGRLAVLEDNKSGALAVLKPVIAGALLAALGYICLSVLHTLGMGSK